MTWLCDFERCYRQAVLYVLPDFRRRPRCERHKPAQCPTAAFVDRTTRENVERMEKGGVRPDHVVVDFTTTQPIKFDFTKGTTTGVPPNTGDYVGTAWPVNSSAGDCVAGNNAGNARYTFGCYGGSHSGPCDDECVDPRKVEFKPEPITDKRQYWTTHDGKPAPIDKTLLDASTRKALENVEKPAPTFRVGQWVRFKDSGDLGQIKNPRGCYCGPNGEACFDIQNAPSNGLQAHGGTFEPALPRAGEWWLLKDCEKPIAAELVHGPLPLTHSKKHLAVEQERNVPFEFAWEHDALARECVACGCLVPVNWGKGNA